ncbi:MAG TPA: hypothetical protein VHG08_22300, partial [Longimicrobium sp.]|nr:hypothetical protein [Longimicrobium sp.]
WITGARKGMMRRTARRVGVMLVLGAVAAACRDRGGAAKGGEPVQLDSVPSEVQLRLYVARDWAWNEEDTLRLTVVNRTNQPLAGEVSLFVGSPVELLFDTAGSNSNSAPPPSTLSSGEGTRVTFPLGSLAPGESGEFRQAVRTPPAPLRRRPTEAADTATRFAVRAWVTAGDSEVARAADTIRIRPGSEVVRGGCGGVQDVAVTRYGIGPLRLEMLAGDVRTLCPEARDTMWQGQEGMRERGLAVRLAGHPVTLVLAGDKVQRIVVDTAGLRTGVGVGVGSTLAELRGRYGRMCAGKGEGRIAVWFPAAPGVSFGVDPRTAGPATGTLDPETLPDTAKVDRMWVRQGSDDCPAPES